MRKQSLRASITSTILVSLVVTISLESQLHATVIALQPGPVEGKDVSIADGILLPQGNDDDFIINWGDGMGNQLRTAGLIEFDLSTVPSGVAIQSATLSLFHRVNNNLNRRYDIFRISSPWDEATTTFSTAPSFDPISLSTLLISDSSSSVYRSWNVTNLVQGWTSGSSPNFGMWIEEVPVLSPASAYFRSSDAVASERPILRIEYSSAAVPEISSFLIWTVGSVATIFVRRKRVH